MVLWRLLPGSCVLCRALVRCHLRILLRQLLGPAALAASESSHRQITHSLRSMATADVSACNRKGASRPRWRRAGHDGGPRPALPAITWRNAAASSGASRLRTARQKRPKVRCSLHRGGARTATRLAPRAARWARSPRRIMLTPVGTQSAACRGAGQATSCAWARLRQQAPRHRHPWPVPRRARDLGATAIPATAQRNW